MQSLQALLFFHHHHTQIPITTSPKPLQIPITTETTTITHSQKLAPKMSPLQAPRLVTSGTTEDGKSIFIGDEMVEAFHPFGPTRSGFYHLHSRLRVPVSNTSLPPASIAKTVPRCPPNGVNFGKNSLPLPSPLTSNPPITLKPPISIIQTNDTRHLRLSSRHQRPHAPHHLAGLRHRDLRRGRLQARRRRREDPPCWRSHGAAWRQP